MPITTATCTSFKQEILVGTHNFTNTTGDTFKMALIKATPTGTYGAATTSYTDVTGNSDEASGTGYTATGSTTTSSTPATSGTTAYLDFSDITWGSSTISADGCILYNDTATGDPAIAVWAFSSTRNSSNGNFIIQFPAPGASTSVLRIA